MQSDNNDYSIEFKFTILLIKINTNLKLRTNQAGSIQPRTNIK